MRRGERMRREKIEEYGQRGRLECTAYRKKVVLEITAYN
jgi:hypothetical protein